MSAMSEYRAEEDARLGWRASAACRNSDTDLFFPPGNTGPALDQVEAAKAVCQWCPVRQACLQFAFETGQTDGVWGGTDEIERAKLRRAWRREPARAGEGRRSDARPSSVG